MFVFAFTLLSLPPPQANFKRQSLVYFVFIFVLKRIFAIAEVFEEKQKCICIHIVVFPTSTGHCEKGSLLYFVFVFIYVLKEYLHSHCCVSHLHESIVKKSRFCRQRHLKVPIRAEKKHQSLSMKHIHIILNTILIMNITANSTS